MLQICNLIISQWAVCLSVAMEQSQLMFADLKLALLLFVTQLEDLIVIWKREWIFHRIHNLFNIIFF